MDLVNFQVGSKTVALPILNILLTERYEQNLTELPNENPSFIGVKDFMNVPVPVFDLGKILNKGSTADANRNLSQSLTQLKDDTLSWLQSLEGVVSGQSKKNKVGTPEQTKFCKWLADFSCDNEDLQSLLERIPAPLSELYEFFMTQGDNEFNEGDWHRRYTSVTSHVQRLFESAVDQVDVGYKPIIVFTTTDGRDPHVGLLVDKVEDSIHVDEADIKKLDSVTAIGFQLDAQTTAMMQGLVQLEDKHSLIIDPSSLFIEIEA